MYTCPPEFNSWTTGTSNGVIKMLFVRVIFIEEIPACAGIVYRTKWND
ncbi:hypothetical protein [Bizionia arctica]|nr:hypothetical protein [Bizionia arctica]